MATARALRRNGAGADSFPQDVVELIGYFGDARRSGCRRSPGRGRGCRSGSSAPASSGRSSRPTWGCPMPSPPISRRGSRGGARGLSRELPAFGALAAPHAMLAFNVFAAETTRRRGGSGRRCSRRSPTCGPGGRGRCRRRWRRSRRRTRRRWRSRTRRCACRRRGAGDGAAGARGLHRGAPARRDHPDRADPRPRTRGCGRSRSRPRSCGSRWGPAGCGLGFAAGLGLRRGSGERDRCRCPSPIPGILLARKAAIVRRLQAVAAGRGR